MFINKQGRFHDVFLGGRIFSRESKECLFAAGRGKLGLA
jgi:hypothetical protein